MKRICFLMIVLLLLLSSLAQAATYYVATTGNNNNPGTPAQPFRTIAKGIATAASGDTVQVASGTYNESLDWVGTSLTLKGAGSGQSIIDGSGTQRCLMLTSVPSDARIEGFTIRNGCMQSYPYKGGGMYLINSSPTVSNCLFQVNQAGSGGGMFNDASSPTVTGCTFQNNSILFNGLEPSGGAICNNDASFPYITNCVFTGNYEGQGNCGGISNLGGYSVVTNCLFTYNTGNAIVSTGRARVIVTNCVFYGNSDYGVFNKNDGVDNYLASVYVSNSIFWANGHGIGNDVAANDIGSYVTHSDVEGGTYGGISDRGGNINANPLFTDGFHLQPTSPCLNKGTADAASLPGTDIDGAPRILGSAPDMGVYELWKSAYGQWFVDRATGSDTNAGSPSAPFRTVVKAITTASTGNKIYIKQGRYGTDRPRITKSLRLFNWTNTGLSRIGQP